MIIAGIFVERLILSLYLLPDRPWSKWEILTLSMTILFLLVWLTRLQRSEKVRKKYHNQFLESTPAMGMKWGFHNKSRHTAKDLKKGRLAPGLIHQNEEPSPTKEPSEKPHKRTKAFHIYTNIYKPNRERFGRRDFRVNSR